MSKRGTTVSIAVALAAIAILSRTWVEVVSHYVPEPYLDEVFHVPQAQKYCEGRYAEWDDKITTPPGLYILSLLVPKNLLATSISGIFSCDTLSLRGVNALALVALTNLALLARWQIEARLHGRQHSTTIKAPSQYAIHMALNIALCPIIFFFSGLYYTDVASTAVVLAAFLNSLQRMGKDKSSVLSDLLTVLLGVLSLFMRQTNVFWVVIFCGGLEAVHAVKTLRPDAAEEPAINTLMGKINFYGWRYSVGDIHDPPSNMAWEDDMIFTALSLVVAAVCNPFRVLRQIWPHLTVLASFAAFIAWNGGVVLGDKSNHVATIHLAQMLYIWPFFAFFSLPLLLPYAIQIITPFFAISGPQIQKSSPQSSTTGSSEDSSKSSGFKISGSSRKRTATKSKAVTSREPSAEDVDESSNPSSTRQDDSSLLKTLKTICTQKLLWLVNPPVTLVASAAIVKFNTIVHPFTLADNRHYMFYVFRYTIRRSLWIRYGLIAVYTISRWMIWGTLRGCSSWLFEDTGEDCSMDQSRLVPFINHPFNNNSHRSQAVPESLESAEVRAEKQGQVDRSVQQDPLAYSTEPVSTSTTLIFLIATSLSLITAPLVEPRYFIIPWVMWRLLVPAWRLHDHRSSSPLKAAQRDDNTLGKALDLFRYYDSRLSLETAWFLAINLATMYIFLSKPYQWRAEDGTILDSGRLQRFMW